MSKSVKIRSFDHVFLDGTLWLPPERLKIKGILIPVHGSFVQTREGALDGTQKWMFPQGVPQRTLFREFTDTVLEVDYGVFAFDKRASGKSGGDYKETTIDTLARDLKKIVETIRGYFPGVPVGVMGQSEGGLVTMWAHRHHHFRPDVILLQNPALEPFDRTLDFQTTHGAKPFLETPTKLAAQYPYLVAFYDAMINGDMMNKIRSTDDRYYTLSWGDWSYVTNLQKYREYLFDGEAELARVTVPVGLFVGGKDLNVNPEVGLRIRAAKGRGEGCSAVKVFYFPELEHSFRRVGDGVNFVDAMKLPADEEYKKGLKKFLSVVERAN